MDCSPLGSSVHRISQQEYRSGCHFLLQGIFPDPGFEPASPVSLALAGRFFTNCTTWEAMYHSNIKFFDKLNICNLNPLKCMKVAYF